MDKMFEKAKAAFEADLRSKTASERVLIVKTLTQIVKAVRVSAFTYLLDSDRGGWRALNTFADGVDASIRIAEGVDAPPKEQMSIPCTDCTARKSCPGGC